MRIRNSGQGFTLLELTIVLIVLGILLVMAFPKFMRTIERSRGAGAYIIIDALKKAEETYKVRYDKYDSLNETTPGGSLSTEWIAQEVPEVVKNLSWKFKIDLDATGDYTITATRTGTSGAQIWYYGINGETGSTNGIY